jgi:hypothetical protein
MLILDGRVLRVNRASRTDRATGVISDRTQAEIYHLERGKSTINFVLIDQSTAAAWEKLAGTDDVFGQRVQIEVVQYAFLDDKKEMVSGLAAADKKAVPVAFRSPPLSAALKAA